MSSYFRILCAVGVFGAAATQTRAQEGTFAEELRRLRLTIEQQTKQIEILTLQIQKLSPRTDGQPPATSSPAVEFSPAPVETPKAEAVSKPEAPRHIVVKGETLTSIAKHYNIPLVELQKANRIEDGRKLQIGQTLLIPIQPPPETSTEKKETP